MVKNIIVVNRTNKNIDYQEKEVSYKDLVSNQSSECDVTEQNSEDPLFIFTHLAQQENQKRCSSYICWIFVTCIYYS